MHQATHTRRKRHSRQQMLPILKAYRESGLSVSAFARQRGLEPATLFRWLRLWEETAAPPSLPPPAFVQALPPAVRAPEPAPGRNGYCLHWPDGRRLEVACGFDRQELRTLWEVLNA